MLLGYCIEKNQKNGSNPEFWKTSLEINGSGPFARSNLKRLLCRTDVGQDKQENLIVMYRQVYGEVWIFEVQFDFAWLVFD